MFGPIITAIEWAGFSLVAGGCVLALIALRSFYRDARQRCAP